jgi:phage baseplate assembly protein W
MIHLNFPFHFDSHGRTALSGDAAYIRQLLELLLFTSPGERLNRPDFGGGLRPLVFAPNSSELEAALQFALKGNLQRWLGDLIEVLKLNVQAEEATLTIDLSYATRRSGEERSERLVRRV